MGSSREPRRVLVIAHRGGAGHAPENTVAACKLAIEMGADAVEVDVRLTADGHVVCFHDARLERRTSSAGRLAEMTFQQLRGLRVDERRWPGTDETIPTLEEVIEICRGRAQLLIELKARPGHPDQLVRKVIELVDKTGAISFSILASNDRFTVERIGELAPEARTALIVNRFHSMEVLQGPWPMLAAAESIVDPGFVDAVHKSNKSLFVWTVDDEARMAALLELGIEGVITNYPDRLVDLLRRWGWR